MDSRNPGLGCPGPDVYQLCAGVSRPAWGRAGSGHAPSDQGRRRGSSHVGHTGTCAAAGYTGMRMPSSPGDSRSSRAMDPTGSVPQPVLRLLSPRSPTWSRQEASSSWELLLPLLGAPTRPTLDLWLLRHVAMNNILKWLDGTTPGSAARNRFRKGP